MPECWDGVGEGNAGAVKLAGLGDPRWSPGHLLSPGHQPHPPELRELTGGCERAAWSGAPSGGT
ncbi:NDRG4 isoform 48 [Pan troglodytes]|uniref:NDRG family member 4 n=2 Tax=Homininae TaxID=207598 RepID=H3BMG5_HUMAN|nr:NDRG family member 4 [Homo sapiens]KAI4055273.1 NDRG family member 4 [Homo sapiens]PNI63581.1 NDRG4 isoform 48 [Pan troglodytes]